MSRPRPSHPSACPNLAGSPPRLSPRLVARPPLGLSGGCCRVCHMNTLSSLSLSLLSPLGLAWSTPTHELSPVGCAPRANPHASFAIPPPLRPLPSRRAPPMPPPCCRRARP
eukprot:7090071-Prymnesium_polylepis.1